MKNKRIKYYIVIVFAWILLFVSLIIFIFYKIDEETDNIAKTEARANFNKDQAIRNWSSLHGGVYVPVDSITKPNPALAHISERDIETPSGRKLTLMNPAYLLRELNDYFAEYYGIVGHLTSKKLLRAENKPDKWELNALTLFEKGEKEVSEYANINNELYLRLMQPLLIEQSCLKCHAQQDYKIGDVRGGIGVSVPMKPLIKKAILQKDRSFSILAILWIVGLIGMFFAYKKIEDSLKKQEYAENTLKVQNQILKEAKEISEKSRLELQNQNYEFAALNEEYHAQNEELRVTIEGLEESKDNFKAIITQSADGITVADKSGNYIVVNPAFCKMSGYSEKELLKMTVFDMKAEQQDHSSFFKSMTERESLPIHVILKRKDNTEYITEIIGKNIIINNKNFVLGTIRDITQKVKFEKELIKAKEKAEESNNLKTEFINNMSHEIRTPMNGILGFSSLLNKGDLTEQKRKYYINIIQNSGNQLMRIIDDILEISRLGTKQVKAIVKEVCLNDLLLEQFSIFDIRAKELKIPLYVKKGLPDNESYILTDKTKLNKILSNLLENALKFTDEGFIEFGYKIIDNKIEIYVQDTGIGIKLDSQKIIFKRFSQEEKKLSKNVGGLGLGLSIAKENAELLDGKITVKSEKGKGSIFFVTIPYKPVNFDREKQNIVNTTIKNKQEKYKILIAEDEEVNYLYLETLLEEIGVNSKILHAKNGKEAVDMCKDNLDIDIILMDLKMPIKNGFHATKQIKEFLPNIPIVAQTAYSTKEEKQQALSVGFNDFISKPISEEIFNRIINKYLK